MTRAAMARALLADAPALEAITRHIIGELWEHPLDAAQLRAALRDAVQSLAPVREIETASADAAMEE